jgi:hypothetical protein
MVPFETMFGRGGTGRVCRLCKTLLFLVMAAQSVFLGASLGADERGYIAGLGAEAGGSSFSNLWLGAAITGEVRPVQLFSFGVRGTVSFFSFNLGFDYRHPEYTSTTDIFALARLYLFSPKTERPFAAEVFLEANGGLHITTWNVLGRRVSDGKAAAGGAAGLRLLFGQGFYLEPFVRAAYPLSFSTGILMGARAHTVGKKTAEKAPAGNPEPTRDSAATDAQAGTASGIAEVFLIMFAPNTAVYDGPALQGDLRETNRETLRRIAALLKEYPEAHVVIEGAAAAILSPRQNVPAAPLTIGERRAFAVTEYLYAAGIERNRMVIPSGGMSAGAPRDGRAQRIEVRVLR